MTFYQWDRETSIRAISVNIKLHGNGENLKNLEMLIVKG
jgi:hypothetical protein